MEASSDSDQKMEHILETKYKMQKIIEGFFEEAEVLFQQWDLELQQFKGRHENLYNELQQEKLSFQRELLQTMRCVLDKYIKNSDSMLKGYNNILMDTQCELKEEVNSFKGKFMKGIEQKVLDIFDRHFRTYSSDEKIL